MRHGVVGEFEAFIRQSDTFLRMIYLSEWHQFLLHLKERERERVGICFPTKYTTLRVETVQVLLHKRQTGFWCSVFHIFSISSNAQPTTPPSSLSVVGVYSPIIWVYPLLIVGVYSPFMRKYTLLRWWCVLYCVLWACTLLGCGHVLSTTVDVYAPLLWVYTLLCCKHVLSSGMGVYCDVGVYSPMLCSVLAAVMGGYSLVGV